MPLQVPNTGVLNWAGEADIETLEAVVLAVYEVVLAENEGFKVTVLKESSLNVSELRSALAEVLGSIKTITIGFTTLMLEPDVAIR